VKEADLKVRYYGFYWVKYGDQWIVAEFTKGEWWLTGMDEPVQEQQLQIDEQRIERTGQQPGYRVNSAR
jgi:hypothetical protein